jgi:NAD(P)-dependent dehydrogenase (short-subunit alcohol dehydrogenase family)
MAVLDGKTALITGGTTGIGMAAAKLFRQHGAALIVTGQSPERLQDAQRELGAGVEAIRADQSTVDGLSSLVRHVESSKTRIDVLVLNAGVTMPASTEVETEDRFDKQLAINLKGPYFTVQKLLPHLADGASIIANTSCLDELGMPGMGVYSASKAALRSLVRTWAAELMSRRIRVNAVAPGPVDTPIYGKLGLPQEHLQAMAADIQSRVPMKRFAAPEEIAGVMLFLASPHASFVNGAEIAADGGWTQL